MFASSQFMGHDIPSPGIALVLVGLMIGFLLLSRNASTSGVDIGGEAGRRVGRGRMHRCKRCGRDFQPEQVEMLATGDVRHFLDERCPGCGWSLEWQDPKKNGGASGTW